MASAIVADGFLYGLSHYGQGRLFCLDPGNGKSSGRDRPEPDLMPPSCLFRDMY